MKKEKHQNRASESENQKDFRNLERSRILSKLVTVILLMLTIEGKFSPQKNLKSKQLEEASIKDSLLCTYYWREFRIVHQDVNRSQITCTDFGHLTLASSVNEASPC